LCWCYLFVSVLCESVFVQGFLIGNINFVLVFSLCVVNDMDWEEGLGKNLFYKDSSSRKALKFPVENVSTEISKGTLSSHPVSRCRNLCFSLFLILCNKILLGYGLKSCGYLLLWVLFMWCYFILRTGAPVVFAAFRSLSALFTSSSRYSWTCVSTPWVV